MIDPREDLLRMFEYDLWSTEAWLPFAEIEEIAEVLEHIIWAQAIWLERSGAHRYTTTPNFLGLAQDLNAGWREHLAVADLEEVVKYQNSVGSVFTQRRYDIARHVLNHGTYHRGQIRGLVQAMEIEEFPDTDYIFYLRDRGL